MQAIMKTLSIHKDPSRQLLWFSGTLQDGHQFAIGFPIAHVVVTFDQTSSSMGSPMYSVCAGIPSIDGFFDGVQNLINRGGQVAQATRSAQSTTMKSLANQAMHYASAAAKQLKRPTGFAREKPSHAAPAISAAGLAAYHAAHIVTKQAKSNPATARKLAATVRQMVVNPHPHAQLAVAGLQSYRPR